MQNSIKHVKLLQNDWIYGKFIALSVSVLSFFVMFTQFLWYMYNPSLPQKYRTMDLLIVVGICIILYGICYYLDHLKNNRIHHYVSEELYTISKPSKKKDIIRPPYAFDVASWKVQGLMSYTTRSRSHMNDLIKRFNMESKELPQIEKELYMLKKIMDTLLYELDHEEITLSCVDIFYLFSKMEVYYVHKNKGLYESFKKNKSFPEQYKIDIFLDERTLDILMFKLKDRYAFLPADFPKNLALAMKCVEEAADNGNAYAQFDLANMYLSSEFYGGMEAAIFYLYRAQNEHHPSAMAFIDRLRSA